MAHEEMIAKVEDWKQDLAKSNQKYLAEIAKQNLRKLVVGIEQG